MTELSPSPDVNESVPNTGPVSAPRDFLYYAAAGACAVTAGAGTWPPITAMNPTADVTALSSIDIDLDGIEVGTCITLLWQGKPLFIDRGTQEQIALARSGDGADPIDPAPDANWSKRPEWLIVIGICTHLGCVYSDPRPSSRGRWRPTGFDLAVSRQSKIDTRAAKYLKNRLRQIPALGRNVNWIQP